MLFCPEKLLLDTCYFSPSVEPNGNFIYFLVRQDHAGYTYEDIT